MVSNRLGLIVRKIAKMRQRAGEQAAHVEVVPARVGIVPRILKLRTEWRQGINFTLWSLYPHGKNLRYP